MTPGRVYPVLSVIVSVIEPRVLSPDAVGMSTAVAPSVVPLPLDLSPASTIRLLCLDHHPKIISALALMTSMDPAFGVVRASTAGSDKGPFDPAKVCNQIVRHQTSIVVLGNVSEGTDVFSLVREIRSRQPKVRCVFLSSDVRRSSISAAFQCGASGFFAKGDDLRDILNGLRQIAVCNNDEFLLGQKVMAQCRMCGGGGERFALAGPGPAHQSWTPMTILSDPLGRLERFGADVAE